MIIWIVRTAKTAYATKWLTQSAAAATLMPTVGSVWNNPIIFGLIWKSKKTHFQDMAHFK